MSGEPSPYVSVYMTRRQAEETLRALRSHAKGKAASNVACAALRTVEKAVARNDGSAS